MATGTNGIATWDELLRYKYPNGITPTSDVLSMCTNDGVDAISNANEIVLGFAVSDSAGSVNDSIGPSTYNTQYVTLSVTGHTYADNQGVRYSDILPSRPIYLKMDFTQASTGYWSYTWQYVYADGTVAAIADLGNNTRNFGGGVRVSANTSTWVHEHSSYISCYSENDGASQSSSSPTAVTGSVTNRVQTSNGVTLGIYPTGSTDETSLIYNYSTAYKNNNISNYPANSVALITFTPYGAEPYFSLSTTASTITSANTTFYVTVASNTSWTISYNIIYSDTDYGGTITLSPEAGSGNATITVSVPSNPDIDYAREINIIGVAEGGFENIVTVTQNKGVVVTSYIIFTSSTSTVSSAATTIYATVSANTSWTIQYSTSYYSSISPTTGTSGNTTIELTTVANSSTSSRTLYATATTTDSKNAVLSITQSAKASPTSRNITLSITKVINAEVQEYQALTNIFENYANALGTGNGGFYGETWYVNGNSSYPVTVGILFNSSDVSVDAPYAISNGTNYYASMIVISGETYDTTSYETIEDAQDNPFIYTATTAATSVTISTTNSRINGIYGTCVFTTASVAAGTSETTASITGTYSPAENASISITSSTSSIGSAATSFTVTIISNVAWTLTLGTGLSTTGSLTGTGNETRTISATANSDTANTRTLRITATTTGSTASSSCSVTQAKAYVAPTISLTSSTSSVGSGVSTFTFTVTSNTGWTLAYSTGLSLSSTAGTGNATITATTTANSDTANTRTLSVTGTTTSGSKTSSVSVTQAKKGTSEGVTYLTYISPAVTGTGFNTDITLNSGQTVTAAIYYGAGYAPLAQEYWGCWSTGNDYAMLGNESTATTSGSTYRVGMAAGSLARNYRYVTLSTTSSFRTIAYRSNLKGTSTNYLKFNTGTTEVPTMTTTMSMYGSYVGSGTYSASKVGTPRTLQIMCNSATGTTASWPCETDARFYGLRVYTTTTRALVHDLRPALKDGVYGLYDDVTLTFYAPSLGSCTGA